MFHFVHDSTNLALTMATFVMLVTRFPIVILCIDIGPGVEQMNGVSNLGRLNHKNNEVQYSESEGRKYTLEGCTHEGTSPSSSMSSTRALFKGLDCLLEPDSCFHFFNFGSFGCLLSVEIFGKLLAS